MYVRVFYHQPPTILVKMIVHSIPTFFWWSLTELRNRSKSSNTDSKVSLFR